VDYNKHETLKGLPKSPILIKKKNATDSEGDATVLKKFLFKFGDDLRQDNLVLQFFKIMDRLWQSSGDDLQMMCYDVMETGFGTGYIEFIDNATVIT
jgi:phosphatidylinositol-4,5-bisphosphate 3-kinase